MLKSIRKYFEFENNNILNNRAWVDKIYIGGMNKNRHANKKLKNHMVEVQKKKLPNSQW